MLDIELVPWMDYTSVAAILRLAEVAKRDGTYLKCINVRPQPMRKLSHLLKMNPDVHMELVPNEADADAIDEGRTKEDGTDYYHHEEDEINEPLLPPDPK